MIEMKLFDSIVMLPDSVAVLPADTLDEHGGVYRVALSDMWFDGQTKLAIEFITELIQRRSKGNWLKQISFEVDNKTVTYTMVYVDITEKYGYKFLEFEVGMNGVQVDGIEVKE